MKLCVAVILTVLVGISFIWAVESPDCRWLKSSDYAAEFQNNVFAYTRARLFYVDLRTLPCRNLVRGGHPCSKTFNAVMFVRIVAVSLAVMVHGIYSHTYYVQVPWKAFLMRTFTYSVFYGLHWVGLKRVEILRRLDFRFTKLWGLEYFPVSIVWRGL